MNGIQMPTIRQVKVVSVDVVKYSLRKPPLQAEIVGLFTGHLRMAANAALGRAAGQAGWDPDQIVFLPSGDGALVLFLRTDLNGHHDIHLIFSEKLLELVREHNQESVTCGQDCKHHEDGPCQCQKYDLRIGISQGLAAQFTDVNGNAHNYAGTPLNEATRIMGQAPANRIALSTCVFDEIGGWLQEREGRRIVRYPGLVKHGLELYFYVIDDPSNEPVDADGTVDLNELFNGYNKVMGVLTGGRPPALVEANPNDILAGQLEGLEEKIAQQQEKLGSRGQNNDPHALLQEIDLFAANPFLTYYATDFATVEVLRAGGVLPKVVSASAVVGCGETRQIFLHHRSRGSSTYPDCLHTLGGALKPRSLKHSGFSLHDPNLVATATREVLEESGLSIQWRQETPLWLLREVQTGFVQLLLAGVAVTADNVAIMSNSWEGKVLPVSFDDLEEVILLHGRFQPERTGGRKWTPTGLLGVLLWLAGGACGAGAQPLFGGKGPRGLYHALIKRIKTEGGIKRLLGQPLSKS